MVIYGMTCVKYVAQLHLRRQTAIRAMTDQEVIVRPWSSQCLMPWTPVDQATWAHLRCGRLQSSQVSSNAFSTSRHRCAMLFMPNNEINEQECNACFQLFLLSGLEVCKAVRSISPLLMWAGMAGSCSIQGFTGTDQEWREEFDLLRQECTQAASQGDNDGESLVGDSIKCLGPAVSVFWEGQTFIDFSFIFVAWLQLDQPKTRVISSCVHDFFPHVFKPTAVSNF